MLKFNQLLLIVSISLLALSCGKTGNKTVNITGNIENATADSVFIIGDNLKKAIPLKNSTFADTLKITSPIYLKFYAGNQFTWLYLEPGADLTLKTDMNQFDQKLKYEGKLAPENNYLALKIVKDQQLSGNPSEFFTLDQKSFQNKVVNYKNEVTADLDKADASKEFMELEKKNIQYTYLLMLAQYPEANSFFTKNNTEMPAEFEKELNSVSLDNESDYNSIPAYKDLVLYRTSAAIDKMKSADEVEKLVAGIKSQNIREGIMSNLLLYTISSGGPNAQKYFEIVTKYSKDEAFKKRTAIEFEQIKKLLPGSPSPQFIYPDINGKDVALSDLKGKLVYIDVWATWCVPCLQEIPSLKQLEGDYHDKGIQFVSMSIDQKKDFEKWQLMVKEKELKGIQIFSDNDWHSQFVRDYNINGIPRFILLDKDGKIINADAPRPSDPGIRFLIDENL